MERQSFWMCLIDGEPWLMWNDLRVCKMSSTLEELVAALAALQK